MTCDECGKLMDDQNWYLLGGPLAGSDHRRTAYMCLECLKSEVESLTSEEGHNARSA